MARKVVMGEREQVIQEIVDALRAAETPCNINLYGPAACLVEEKFLATASAPNREQP